MAVNILFIHWSLLLDVISGIQQHVPNKPKVSTCYTSSNIQDIVTKKPQHQRNSSTRRNVLVSIATGVTTSLPFVTSSILLPSDTIVANAATTPTIAFRAYQVQPDSGEKLNPTLTTLTVRATFHVEFRMILLFEKRHDVLTMICFFCFSYGNTLNRTNHSCPKYPVVRVAPYGWGNITIRYPITNCK